VQNDKILSIPGMCVCPAWMPQKRAGCWVASWTTVGSSSTVQRKLLKSTTNLDSSSSQLETSELTRNCSMTMAIVAKSRLRLIRGLLHDLEACPWLASWSWSWSLSCFMILKPVLGWLRDLEASPCLASWSWSLSLAWFMILKPVLGLLHEVEAHPWLAWWSLSLCLACFSLEARLWLASWSWSFCFSGFVFLKLMCMPLKSWSLFATWLTSMSRLPRLSSLCHRVSSYSMVLKLLLGSFRDHKG